MNTLKQIKYRLKILESMIKIFSNMPHNSFSPKQDIDDIMFVLTEWKYETELLLKHISK